MDKNLKMFVLACNCLLLYTDHVRSFGLKGEREANKLLVNKGIILEGISESLKGFLELFY